MAVEIQRVGFDEAGDRALFQLSVKPQTEIPKHKLLSSRYFSALIAWDARDVSPIQIVGLAKILLDAGCVYFCCWGPDCERVHDAIDEEYARDGITIHDNESTIMTTWHSDDSLEEAAWFSLRVAFPDDRVFDQCKAVLGVCIDNHMWAEQIARAFQDPLALSARVV